MQAISSITPVPESPLSIRIEPFEHGKGGFYTINCWLTNDSANNCFIDVRDVMIRLRSVRTGDWSSKPSFMSLTEGNGTTSTYVWSAAPLQQFATVLSAIEGRLASANRLMLLRGESIPVVAKLEFGLSPGNYEIELQATASDKTFGTRWPVRATWLGLDVPGSSVSSNRPTQSLTVQSKSVVPIADGYEVCLTLMASGDKPRSILVPLNSTSPSWAGRLKASTADDRGIHIATSEERRSESEWHFSRVAEAGHEVKFRFRQERRFSGQSIHRIELELLTDQGLESFLLADGFDDIHAVTDLPPYGSLVQSAKLRARPVKQKFKAGDQLQFYVQATNETGQPMVWWMPLPQYPANRESYEIEIDGQKIDLPSRRPDYVFGWAAPWTCGRPCEWTCVLPSTLRLSPGKHTFRCSLLSPGGSYRNSLQNDVPLLDGSLTTTAISFEVGE
jgi:hypothetical protein